MNCSVDRKTVLLVALTGCAALLPNSSSFGQRKDRYEAARRTMVDLWIRSEGITNEAVLNSMLNTPRHEFVAAGLRSQAYLDMALPIGAQQTITSPFVVAYMTSMLEPGPEDRVLEIGTGSGYQAAVLSPTVNEVYSIEIVESLAKSAKARLERLGYENVFTRHGDGYQGWPEKAPFDCIIVTCSPESVPEPLIDQLKEGGRMIIPLGERYQQAFYLLKKEAGAMVEKKLVPTLFVPMTGQSEDLRRVKPDPDRPALVNGDFELDVNDDGRADGWHYQRQVERCSEEPMSGAICLRFQNTDPDRPSQALQGLGLNGRNIGALEIRAWARPEGVLPSATGSSAGVIVHFYDAIRREVGSRVVCRWRGSENWQQVRRRVPVPSAAREMIIRIGLNGAIGQLDVDQVQISAVPR